MTDQERMTDLIFCEKKMSDNYSIWASECTNTQLRDTFLDLLNQSHKTQTDLFQTAQQKGWYKTIPQAQPDMVQQAYQQFSSQAPN
ncbi:MAG: spore coat protein [Oscillospiraceae bacterium]|jgi:spore coat protein CotF